MRVTRRWAMAALAALVIGLTGPAADGGMAGSVAEAARPAKPGVTVVRLAAGPDAPERRGVARATTTRAGQRFSVLSVVPGTAAGTVLEVFVGADKVGSMAVTADGVARLELWSRHGDAVPSIASGAEVSVKRETGEVLLSGRAS